MVGSAMVGGASVEGDPAVEVSESNPEVQPETLLLPRFKFVATAVLEDAAGGDLAKGLVLERELADQRLERGGRLRSFQLLLRVVATAM
jgi:hypothetical protein